MPERCVGFKSANLTTGGGLANRLDNAHNLTEVSNE